MVSMHLLMNLMKTMLRCPARQNLQNETFRFASLIRSRQLCFQQVAL